VLDGLKFYSAYPDFASPAIAAFSVCHECDEAKNCFEFRKPHLSCCNATKSACNHTSADYNSHHAAVQHGSVLTKCNRRQEP
jgi:hypothetical protein